MINLSNIEKDSLIKQIEDLKKELTILDNEHYETVFLDSVLQMDDEQIEELAKQYNIDYEDFLKTIKLYKECLALSEESVPMYSITIKTAKIKIERIIILINNAIKDKLDKKKEKNESIKEDIAKIETIIDYIYENKNNIKEVLEVLKSLPIDEREKVELSRRIALKRMEVVLESKKEHIVVETPTEFINENVLFEKKKSENYDLVISLIEKYKDFFDVVGLDTQIDNLSLYVEDDELDEIKSLTSISFDDAVCYLYTLITMIRDCKESEKDKYIELIDFLYNNFLDPELLIKTRNLLANKEQLDSLYKLIYMDMYKYEEYYELLSKLKSDDKLLIAKDKLNFILSLVSKIGPIEQETTKDKKDIKGFVLFDYDRSGKTYVTSDLDPNKNSKVLFGRELEIAIEEVNKMITDLFVYGEMETLINITSSTSNNSNRLVSPVYRDLNKKKKTDMYRLKPSISSSARIIERKFIIHHGTPVFNQVISIIKEILPYVNIDEEKDFILYIAYEISFKKANTDLYDESIRRYDSSSLTDFIKRMISNENEELSESDYKLLKEFFKDSIESIMSLDKEKNKDSLLDFSVIKELSDSKKIKRGDDI